MKKVFFSLMMLVLATSGAWSATLVVDPVNGPYYDIQSAVTAAVDTDVISIVAGTYVQTAQLVIDKDLTLLGAGTTQTIIEPGFNTSAGYYLITDALIYVAPGVTATIENLAIDGTGFTVKHAIQSRGTDLTVRNCEFRDIYATIYGGRGIVFLTGTGLVENCTMTNIQRIGVHIRGAVVFPEPVVDVDGLTYTGKGAGDFLDYGVEFGGGGGGTVANSVITACLGLASSDGSTSAGILVTDYYGTGTTADITSSTLTGNTSGVVVGYDVADLSVATVHDCDLSGNVEFGVESVGPVVDASINWWGDNDPSDNISTTGSIAFSPWLGAAPGTTPMTWYVDATSTIQGAVNLANPGDTVVVAAGTYAESVSLNKPLTLQGANAGVHPVVGMHPTETVGVRGPETILSTAHAIVPSADYITVDGFMLTGDGGRIVDTYADANFFHLTNCIFDNGVAGTTQGVLQFGGGIHTDMTLDFNLFQDQGDHTIYTGGGPYDRMSISWNRFNVLGEGLFWTALPLVDGVIQGNELDGTIGGVPGTGFVTFNAGQLGNVQIKDNWGHDLAYSPFQVGIIGGSITNNIFERIYPYPGYYGYCFQLYGGIWGTAISDDVLVEDNIFRFNDIPGATLPIHGFDITDPDSGPGVDGTTIVFRNNQFLDGGVVAGPLALRHRGDPTLWVDAIQNFWGDASGPYHATLNPGGTGADVGDYVTFTPWTGMAGGDIVPVTTGPLNCNQTITLTFNYTADEYTPDLFLYNAVVSATSGLDFGTIADLEPFGTENNNFYFNETGANEWTITGSTVGSPTYPVTGVGTTGLFSIVFSATGDVNGAVVFDSLTLRDPSNATIPVDLTGATITYDCTAPAAVTAITAGPRHNKVDVSWTHDLDDVDHFEVFRGLWYDTTVGNSAYPEYDDVGAIEPTRPSAYEVYPGPAGEWVAAGSTATPVNAFTDIGADGVDPAFDPAGADRGVYYYEVFAVDAAGNASAVAPANDRATNYWLGDVTGEPSGAPNGLVQSYDITALGDAFGTIDGGPTENYNNIIDVGPTDDWSRLGVPTTDDKINFEDLMVFSMNFGVVGASKATPPISKVIDLAWVRYDDGRQALRLVSGSGVKGLNVRAKTRVSDVTAGDLLDQQSELTFLKNVGESLDVSIAVTGTNVGFSGSGDLFVIAAAEMIDVADLSIKVRGYDNSQLEFRMDEKSGSLAPRAFALNPNYPNPFNPMTKISFSLPEAQDVRLAVYGVDGRLVATLLNETRGPGLHEVVWTGQDDTGRQAASGMYFYRIEAGPYSQVHKMTLMK